MDDGGATDKIVDYLKQYFSAPEQNSVLEVIPFSQESPKNVSIAHVIVVSCEQRTEETMDGLESQYPNMPWLCKFVGVEGDGYYDA